NTTTFIVNPAIDHSIFYPRSEIDDDLVEIDPDKFTVLSFGKEVRWKGFPEALESMSKLMEKEENIQFIAYGKEKPSYDSPIDYDFVKFPSDNELAQLYSHVDTVISASWYESFPLPPIEAMACGTPVVTTRYGTEDYADHENNAMVVPPKEPEKMAEAILELKENEQLRDRISKNAQSTAKKYTWEKTVDKVEEIFRNPDR
ncbi:MAG: glycosyltransferase family 4 protein, partial [Halobacteriaceae archaeon]